MTRFLAITRTEMLILRRNRWLLVATLIMVLFALALTFAGSAPTGTLGVDMLTVSVASMTTLSVYLAPLLALMIAFDAIAGDVDRGSLSLLLSYPAGRGEILLGKFTAHLAALAFAMTIGFGTAGAVAAFFGGAGPRKPDGAGPPHTHIHPTGRRLSGAGIPAVRPGEGSHGSSRFVGRALAGFCRPL